MAVTKSLLYSSKFYSTSKWCKTRVGATFCPHFLWMIWWIVDKIVDKGKKLLITSLSKNFSVDQKKSYAIVYLV